MGEIAFDWESWLKELLCRLYRQWGGDCTQLSGAPALIAAIESCYQADGPPTFGKPEDLEEFLGLLNDIEAHLDSKDNSLPAASDAQLRALIASLRSDLQPGP